MSIILQGTFLTLFPKSFVMKLLRFDDVSGRYGVLVNSNDGQIDIQLVALSPCMGLIVYSIPLFVMYNYISDKTFEAGRILLILVKQSV